MNESDRHVEKLLEKARYFKLIAEPTGPWMVLSFEFSVFGVLPFGIRKPQNQSGKYDCSH
ncbi:MAG TPA: hypothetical protein VK463_06475 [Desulfomonilaceae bacterium]|nr:hypothetical protein [Desulfomonilaceae bacterium]